MKQIWRYIEEDKVNADYGMALDDFLMDSYSDTPREREAVLRLYTYKDYCAFVGRFQNIHAELDLAFCEKEKIQYNRRLTGGGAIIMGNGQLGLCLATANTFNCGNTREMYALFSKPVLKALEELGIQGALKGKNDLEVNGKKIAGLGIYVNPHGAIQFHTSLLVDLDIPLMLKVLNIPLQKIGDKAQIHKVEQRITTVSREIGRKINIAEMRQRIKNCFEKHFDIQLFENGVNPKEQLKIEHIADEKYRKEDWIFQRSPQPDMTGMGLKKTKAGLLRTYVALKGETIKSVLVTGDFFGHEVLFKNIEANLKWSPIDKDKISKVIQKAHLKYGQQGGVSAEEIIESIWRATMGAMKEVQYTYNGSCYYPKTEAEKEKELKKI